MSVKKACPLMRLRLPEVCAVYCFLDLRSHADFAATCRRMLLDSGLPRQPQLRDSEGAPLLPPTLSYRLAWNKGVNMFTLRYLEGLSDDCVSLPIPARLTTAIDLHTRGQCTVDVEKFIAKHGVAVECINLDMDVFRCNHTCITSRKRKIKFVRSLKNLRSCHIVLGRVACENHDHLGVQPIEAIEEWAQALAGALGDEAELGVKIKASSYAASLVLKPFYPLKLRSLRVVDSHTKATTVRAVHHFEHLDQLRHFTIWTHEPLWDLPCTVPHDVIGAMRNLESIDIKTFSASPIPSWTFVSNKRLRSLTIRNVPTKIHTILKDIVCVESVEELHLLSDCLSAGMRMDAGVLRRSFPNLREFTWGIFG